MRADSKQTNVTPKKRRANRKNAQKSTGPKTPAGKARSSRNALKHGLLSQQVVIDTGDGVESLQDFQTLLRRLHAEFQPTTVMEAALVERIATCFWRLRRAQRFEVGAIRESLDDCNRDDGSMQKTLDSLLRRLAKAQLRLEADGTTLSLLQDLGDLTNSQTAESIRPDLEKIAARVFFLTTDVPTPDLATYLLALFTKRIDEAQHRLRRLEIDLDSASRYEQLRLSRRSLSRSLPASQEVLKLVRYETMLDRQLHRALDQLNRARKRRRQSENTQTSPKPHRSASSSRSAKQNADFQTNPNTPPPD